MLKIGNIEIKGRVALAPMAGYTSLGYRNFMSQFGVSFAVTEMVSDMGLIYGNKETFTYIDFPKSDIPTGVQLFGNEPENLAKALLICEKYNPNIDFYDVNMGCPVHKVTKTGAGSSLLKDPQKCGDIIRALKAVTDKPISAKIRLGWDNNSLNYLEVIDELIKAGVDLITIHPRTTKQLYTGEPHYELIRNLKDKVSVPLFISGNIYTPEDAIKALEITHADGVMAARGAVGDPLLITNINNVLENKEIEPTDINKQVQFCKDLAKDLIKEKGEAVAMRVFRSMAAKFFNGFPNSKKVKNRLSVDMSTYQDLENILSDYLKEEF